MYINQPTTGCSGGSCDYPNKLYVSNNVNKETGLNGYGEIKPNKDQSNSYGFSNSQASTDISSGCPGGSCGGQSKDKNKGISNIAYFFFQETNRLFMHLTEIKVTDLTVLLHQALEFLFLHALEILVLRLVPK